MWCQSLLRTMTIYLSHSSQKWRRTLCCSICGCWCTLHTVLFLSEETSYECKVMMLQQNRRTSKRAKIPLGGYTVLLQTAPTGCSQKCFCLIVFLKHYQSMPTVPTWVRGSTNDLCGSFNLDRAPQLGTKSRSNWSGLHLFLTFSAVWHSSAIRREKHSFGRRVAPSLFHSSSAVFWQVFANLRVDKSTLNNPLSKHQHGVAIGD